MWLGGGVQLPWSAVTTQQEATATEPQAANDTLFGLPRRILLIGTAVALMAALVAGIITTIVTSDSEPDPASPTLDLTPAEGVVGTATPIEYESFDGETLDTAAYRGRPTVVNFFANWCPPCVAEMPDFEAVYQEVGDQVAFLGLSSLESAEDALGLIERTGITYDVGRDATGDAFAEVGGVQMPTTVFIDANGTIVEVHTGALTADALRERIERIS